MIWFTADEHYGHANIIRFQKRPFNDLFHMHMAMQVRFNSKVRPTDTTYHIGDFSLESDPRLVEVKYIQHLNGTHHFIMGSHDRWLRQLEKRHSEINIPPYRFPYLIEKMFDKTYIVLCHYAMLKWPRSHHGSLQLFGHSHGRLDNELPVSYNPLSQMDVGVDTNKFYPYSLTQITNKLKGDKYESEGTRRR